MQSCASRETILNFVQVAQFITMHARITHASIRVVHGLGKKALTVYGVPYTSHLLFCFLHVSTRLLSRDTSAMVSRHMMK